MVLTDEERRAKQIIYQREYQREYQKNKYHADPEYAENKKRQVLERYALLTQEQKEKRNNYAKDYYRKRKQLKMKIKLENPPFEIC